MQQQSTLRIPLKARDGSIKGWALVDAADYEWLSQWKWRMSPQKYAVRMTVESGVTRAVLMHRRILDASPGVHVDHVNGDRLDNRRSNLRIASYSENGINRPKPRSNTSGFKGVSWDSRHQKWRAAIQVRGKSMKLGRFDKIEEAAEAYNVAATEYFGEFAQLNDVG